MPGIHIFVNDALYNRFKQEPARERSKIAAELLEDYFKKRDNPYREMTPEERARIKQKLEILKSAEDKIKELGL